MADDYKKVQEEYEKMMEAMFSGKSSEEVAASILQQQEAMMQHMDMDQVMKEAMGAAAAMMNQTESQIQAQTEAMIQNLSASMAGGENPLSGLTDSMGDFADLFGGDPEELTRMFLGGDDPEYDLESINEKIQSLRVLEKEPGVTLSRSHETFRTFEILLTAYMSLKNAHEMDGLAMEEDPEFIDQIKDMLESSWGITNPAELTEKLRELTTAGHQAKYSRYQAAANPQELMDDPEDEEELESVLPCWKLAQYFKDKLPENYILGWDYGRAATVVRWGYTVGYINEEDSWTWLDQIAEKMIDVFDSWTEFGLSYVFGSLFWIAAFDGEQGISERFEEGIELLTELLDEDEDGQPGVWAQCAWISELTD